MTIESKIEALTAAVLALNETLKVRIGTPATPAAAPAPAPVVPVAEPLMVTPAPAPTPVVPAAAPTPAVMPAPPSFAAPAPIPAVTPAVPFSDAKGLMDYVMARYKALGSEKGGKIHGVLLSLGCNAITDVKPEQYAGLFAGVEAIQ